MKTVNLYEAKTQLSALVDAAAAGEEIVIAKNGVAKAKLVPVPSERARRVPVNVLGIDDLPPDWDEPDPEFLDALHNGALVPDP